MRIRRTLALGGATLALVLLSTSAALATTVSVRVEGIKRTLLSTKTVHTHSGSITRYGAPPGSCPSSSAAGALNVATKGNWGGTYSQSVQQIELTSIMGESWPFSQLKDYWGIWIDNHYATTGMCLIKLKPGDRLLFAADSDNHHEHPLGLSAPATATVGRSFKVKVVWYSDSGKARGLKGVRIGGATTNNSGVAAITPKKAGKLSLKASSKGYIRSAGVHIKVS